jgi:hypothetical protein
VNSLPKIPHVTPHVTRRYFPYSMGHSKISR